jgi:hypothetical protein
MKRYLNRMRSFTVQLVSEKTQRYQLNDASTPDSNELFIGKIGGDVKGVFVYKSGQIYAVSQDDFSYDFLNAENTRLNSAFSALTLPTSGTVPTMPDEDGV